EDGYVFIVDRKKDMIKTSGFQVWPREIEEILATHPAVAEVGVAGAADALKGEVVHAWVVLRAGQAATEQDLRAYCRERLAPYKVPARVAFRDTLPKTMVGKVLRRVLKDAVRPPQPARPSRSRLRGLREAWRRDRPRPACRRERRWCPRRASR